MMDFLNLEKFKVEVRENINKMIKIKSKDEIAKMARAAEIVRDLLFELETICAAVMDVLSNRTLNTRDDCFLTDYALSKVKELNIKLEGYGNNLPTFKHTYSWYKETINKIEKLIDICIKSLVTMRSNRAYRRAFKKSKSTLKEHIFM